MRMREVVEHGDQHKDVQSEMAFRAFYSTHLKAGARCWRRIGGKLVRCVKLEEGVVVPDALAYQLHRHYEKMPSGLADQDAYHTAESEAQDAAYRAWEKARDELLREMERKNVQR
jgi:hypothetical protein